MEFNLYELVLAFGVSVLTGLGIALLYEPVRIFHKIGFTGSIHYFICDFIFMIIFAVVTYFLCLVMLEGNVRLFVIIGEAAGFVVFSLTIRRVLDKIYDPLIIFFKKFISKLLKITQSLMYNIKRMCATMFISIKNKVIKYVWKKKEKEFRH